MTSCLEIKKPPYYSFPRLKGVSVVSSAILTLNKRFDKWENFLIISCGYVGDFTRFEALAGGAINNLNCQHTREFDQKFSKQSNARWSPRGGGHGRFLMFHYIQFHYI